MDRECHAGALAEANNQRVEALRRDRAAPLGSEDMRARRLFALQTTQGPQFVALDRVNAWPAALRPADVQASGVKLDLVPLQVKSSEARRPCL
jgi:hypothetical protein